MPLGDEELSLVLADLTFFLLRDWLLWLMTSIVDSLRTFTVPFSLNLNMF